MCNGFVTLAVGVDKYYKLAANLLQSHKSKSVCNMPFVFLLMFICCIGRIAILKGLIIK